MWRDRLDTFKMKKAKSDHPYLILSLVIIVWGLNYIVGRCLSSTVVFGYVHITGVLFAFLRYLTGALTMVMILAIRKRRLIEIRQEMRPYGKVLLMSILASSIFVLSANQSQFYVSSGTTAIIINLFPLLVFIYGIRYLDEKVTIQKITGFALGFIGGLMFLYNSLQSVSGFNLGTGILLSILAMAAWAGYTVTLYYLGGADRVTVLGVQLTIASLLILPFLGIYALSSPLVFVLDIWSILGILFSGVITSGIIYILYFKAIEMVGAPRAASFLFLIPFVSLLGDVMLKELPPPIALIGGVVAILGVALIKKDSQ